VIDTRYPYSEKDAYQPKNDSGQVLSGEERLVAKMVRETWEDLYHKKELRRRSAKSFIRDGLDFWIDMADLNFKNVVRLMNDLPPDQRGNDYSTGVPPAMIRYNGVTKSALEWSEVLNQSTTTFRKNMRKYGLCKKTFTRRS